MKRIKYLLLILSFTHFTGSGQENGIDRKGRFLFSIGPEYRVTPFYRYSNFTFNPKNFSGYTNMDKQNSGVALNIDVEYFITKNFGLGFTNSFRYDLVISEFREINGPVGVKEADYKLLLDYHLYLFYYFKILKKGEFFVNAGFSRMNINSEFSVKTTQFDSNGAIEAERYTITNFNFFANKVSLGYKNGIGRIYIGIYTTQIAPYFDETTRFNIPFVGCSFDIGKL